MLEYWKKVPSGGTVDRRPGGRSDSPPQPGAAQAFLAAVTKRRRLRQSHSVRTSLSRYLAFPIIPTFPYSNIPLKLEATYD
jgi:hypothetical protein